MEIAFGEFVVDLDQRRLLRGDREIRLTSKGFALLQVLIENRPKALKKDELVARVWPGTFVGDNNLATLVTDLRTALGDPAQDPRFIRTVYGYGYAFVGETSAQSPVAQASRIEASPWRLIHEDREIVLQPGENLLGGPDPVSSCSIRRRCRAVMRGCRLPTMTPRLKTSGARTEHGWVRRGPSAP